jgi:hypothetical protein
LARTSAAGVSHLHGFRGLADDSVTANPALQSPKSKRMSPAGVRGCVPAYDAAPATKEDATPPFFKKNGYKILTIFFQKKSQKNVGRSVGAFSPQTGSPSGPPSQKPMAVPRLLARATGSGV